MDQSSLVVLLTLVVVVLLLLAAALGLTLLVLMRGRKPAPPEPPKPAKRSAEPLRLLALLQREGRVLDFFLEDIGGASDEQVGAGVRELHRKAQAVLKEHLTLEPVLPQAEGETVEVKPGFDPSAVRLTGNVTGQPPFRGTLQHHGWRVKDYNLPAPPEGQDPFVIAPAEVDLP